MEMTENGKYIIKASTILDITLQDYHQSRQQYGNNSDYHRDSEYKQENLNYSVSQNQGNNKINLNAENVISVKLIFLLNFFFYFFFL